MNRRLIQIANLALASLALCAIAAPLPAQTTAQTIAQTAAPSVSPALFNRLTWRNIGPFRAGRTVAVGGVGGSSPVFYIGAVDGVWVSPDAGNVWKPMLHGSDSRARRTEFKKDEFRRAEFARAAPRSLSRPNSCGSSTVIRTHPATWASRAPSLRSSVIWPPCAPATTLPPRRSGSSISNSMEQ